MVRAGIAFIVLALVAVALSPMAVPSARATDVPVTLIARNISWNVGTESSGVSTITVNLGDTLRLRIENRDTTFHTFTANQFPAAPNQGGTANFLDVSLPVGRIFFVNLTMTASDVGTWQFYCIPHSSGTYPNRAGMVGEIIVTNPALSALALSPASVSGGSASQGTVTLTSATTGGAVVSLSSDTPAVATVPASVTVPAGATTAAFSISTVSVAGSVTVTISATFSGVTETAILTVTPPTPAPAAFDPLLITSLLLLVVIAIVVAAVAMRRRKKGP